MPSAFAGPKLKANLLFITDLDGTLIDSKVAIARSTNATLQEFGAEAVPEEKLFGFIGVPIMQVLAPLVESDRLDDAVVFYRTHLVKHGQAHTSVMPGALDALQSLKSLGAKTCIASNKVSALARAVVEQQGLTALIDDVVGSDFGGPKPDAAMIREAMLRQPAGKTFMFGDRPEDVIAGNGAGAETVFLEGEFDELLNDEGVEPHHRVASWSDLPPLLFPNKS